MAKSVEEFLSRIDQKYHCKIILLEPYNGNRTNISFTFGCGHSVNQLLKSLLLRDQFDYCLECKNKIIEKEKIKYICPYCKNSSIKIETYEKCLSNCEEKYKNLEENIDFVICQICGFHSKSLGTHLNKEHGLTSRKYNKQFKNCLAIAINSSSNYSKFNIVNGNWIAREKEKGTDLTEFWKKVSVGLSKSIMANDAERSRRSKNMTELNVIHRTDEKYKKMLSDTAKITSSRPEILEQRAVLLKRWREVNPEDFLNKCVIPLQIGFTKWRKENPEEFYEKCVKNLYNSYQSHPEELLFNLVSLLDRFQFKRRRFLKSPLILNKTNTKQLDISDKINNIYIEFDGIVHFKSIFGEEALIEKQNRDDNLNSVIIQNNWTLIRISYDRYIYNSKREKCHFKQECLDTLYQILNNNIPGIYKIGTAYGQY